MKAMIARLAGGSRLGSRLGFFRRRRGAAALWLAGFWAGAAVGWGGEGSAGSPSPRPSWAPPADQPGARILWTRVLCREPGRYIGWPTIARRRNGELLAVFSGDRDAHVCPWGKVQLIRSRDGGATWSAPQVICNTPLDDRDAGILETRRGTLIVAWFTSLAFEEQARRRAAEGGRWAQWMRHAEKLTPEIRARWLGYWTRRSTDGGKSWGPPVRTSGSAPHGPIELSDGRLLYVGRRNPHRDTELTVEESRDDGRSWRQIASIPVGAGDNPNCFHEPHAVEVAPGRIVALFRYHYHDPATGRFLNERSFLRQAESRDGGRSWTSTRPTSILGYPPHLIRLEDGRLVCVYGRRCPPYGEYARVSRDGGRTWDAAGEIQLARSDSGDLGYPASAALGPRRILTVFYQIAAPGEKTSLMGTLWELKR